VTLDDTQEALVLRAVKNLDKVLGRERRLLSQLLHTADNLTRGALLAQRLVEPHIKERQHLVI
jgi:hypothetical protein